MSVFKDLKIQKGYNFYSGDNLIEIMFNANSITPKDKKVFSRYIYSYIFEDNIVNVEVEEKLLNSINVLPIIAKDLRDKINYDIKHKKLDKDHLNKLINKFIYESDNHIDVKIGLELCTLCDDIDYKDILEVFSKSGEYCLYLNPVFNKVDEYNDFIFDLAKRSKGVIKLYCVNILEYEKSNIVKWALKNGWKDEKYRVELLLIIMNSLPFNSITNKMTYSNLQLLLEYLYEFIKVLGVEKFCYIDVIEKSMNSLISYLSKKTITKLDVLFVSELYAQCEMLDEQNDIEMIKKLCEQFACDGDYTELYEEISNSNDITSRELINVSNLLGGELEFENVIRFLEKDKSDRKIYEYYLLSDNKPWNVEVSEEDKIKVVKFFLKKFDMDELLNFKKRIGKDELTDEYADFLILSLVLSACGDLDINWYELSLKGLKCGVEICRMAAIKNLYNNKSEIKANDIEILTACVEVEESHYNRNLLKKIIYSLDKTNTSEKINIDDLIVEPHVKDIYLMSSNVAGIAFRNKSEVFNYLEDNERVILKIEDGNPYDKRAIMVVGIDGTHIGYIPRCDNKILYNMITRGRYLYGTIKDCDADDNQCRIRIYESYQYVVEELDTLLILIGASKSSGNYKN
ncbi:MAG: HIRAN domain-containing protein [Clostridium sp.]